MQSSPSRIRAGSAGIGAPRAVPALRVMPARPANTSAVLAMLRRCSPTSLFHRFHGPTDGVAYTEAVLGRASDIVLLAWEEQRCVGMAMLGGDLAAVPHLGVLVEDERQRRGVGTRLVTALACEAGRRGVRFIRADILGEDGALVGRLSRLGPVRVDLSMGTYSVHIDLMATHTAPAPVE